MRDEHGQLTHYVAVFSDISQVKQSQEQLQHLAHHDALTDLPNRLLFSDRLGQALRSAERYQTRVAVLFIDLDDFKQVNDSFDHSYGDETLRTVANRMRALFREEQQPITMPAAASSETTWRPGRLR